MAGSLLLSTLVYILLWLLEDVGCVCMTMIHDFNASDVWSGVQG